MNFPAVLACSSAVAPGQGGGLAHEGFQGVVQDQPLPAFGDQPLVPGDLCGSVLDGQSVCVQHGPHPAAGVAGRHRVAVGADGDPAVPVHPQRVCGAGVERFVGQRLQEGLFDGEVLADGARPYPDAAAVVLFIPCSTSRFSSDKESTPGTGPWWQWAW